MRARFPLLARPRVPGRSESAPPSPLAARYACPTVLLGVLTVSGGAWAGVADAGSTPDAGGCGSVTFEGSCSGSVLTYCDTDTDQVVVLDCVEDLGAGATCMEIDPSFGFDCAAAIGAECLFDDGAGGVVQSFCQGSGAACVEDADTATCLEGVGTCTSTDAGTCRDDLLVVDCQVIQPYAVACDSLGGRCSVDRCVELPEGASCGDGLECAAGLGCDGTDGVCVVEGDAGVSPDAATDSGASPTDSGAASPDAGVHLLDTGVRKSDAGGGEPESSGCSCGTTSRAASDIGSALLLVPLLLVVRARRRR